MIDGQTTKNSAADSAEGAAGKPTSRTTAPRSSATGAEGKKPVSEQQLLESDISRRTLLRIGGFGAAGLALAGMAGCVPEPAANSDAQPEEQKAWEPVQTIEADVVVVGAGSGLWAAYKAATAGLKTVVIEKADSFASANTNIIGGTTAAETVLEKESGVTTTTEQVFTKMMKFAEGSVNCALVRRCLDGARDVLDSWRELGCEFFMGSDRYSTGFDSVHVYLTPNKLSLVETAVTAAGGSIYYGTEGKQLMLDKGIVNGIYATDSAGDIAFKAKAVILATGGFLSDAEMMRQHFGQQVQPGIFTFAENNGAGIKMALEAGAILDTNFAIGSLADAAGFNNKAENILGSYLSEQRNQAFCFTTNGSMLVDRNGERFIDEYSVAANPLAFGGAIQTRVGWFYAIADQKMVDFLTEHSAFDRVGRDPSWPVGPIMFDTPNSRLKEDLNKAIEQGWAWYGDTPEKLAAAAKLPKLPEQIQAYNEACAAGHDNWFYTPSSFLIPLDTGPYYAIQNQVGALSTMGGVRTDNFCRAVDENDRPIPGLYVCASDNGSVFNAPYYEVGGTCSAMCLGTSWVAGQTVVADIQD
jgi:fumarate reductase flavoprotein subunit